MIRLSVKGTKKLAQRAAARRGINARCYEYKQSTFCSVPCKKLTAVMRWYGEREQRGKRGFSPGTLLFFSDHSCPRSELRGARRRKRRR